MKSLLQKLSPYLDLEPTIRWLIMAELAIQLVNAAFLTILNLFMIKNGYSDYEIAGFMSVRFLSVIPLAFPLGLFIKGRKLKPLLYLAAFGVSIFSLCIIYGVSHRMGSLLYFALTCWGISFTFMQVLAIPFILRHTAEHKQSEAITLSHATYSLGMILSGCFIYLFSIINPIFFNEEVILYLIVLIGFSSIYMVHRIDAKETIPQYEGSRRDLTQFDWKLIFKGLLPTFILAVGSGLTIPFINLFFYSVFGMDSERFALVNAGSFVLVAISMFYVPYIRKKYGYHFAITWVQALGIIALLILAGSEYVNHWGSWALYLAVISFLLRQPLMNMAAPVCTELVMSYVGKRNHEMVSALTASIWSGSWFMSSLIFKYLRTADIAYGWIFVITAGLYAIAVLQFRVLIRIVEKNHPRNPAN